MVDEDKAARNREVLKDRVEALRSLGKAARALGMGGVYKGTPQNFEVRDAFGHIRSRMQLIRKNLRQFDNVGYIRKAEHEVRHFASAVIKRMFIKKSNGKGTPYAAIDVDRAKFAGKMMKWGVRYGVRLTLSYGWKRNIYDRFYRDDTIANFGYFFLEAAELSVNVPNIRLFRVKYITIDGRLDVGYVGQVKFGPPRYSEPRRTAKAAIEEAIKLTAINVDQTLAKAGA